MENVMESTIRRGTVRFWVPGIPRPQGSKRAFMRPDAKHPTMMESSKHVGDWRGDIKSKACEFCGGVPASGPIAVHLRFFFSRPKSHYGSGKKAVLLRQDAPREFAMTNRPDTDKLTRAALDALTGVVWLDDSQVVEVHAMKSWCCRHTGGPGLDVQVVCLE